MTQRDLFEEGKAREPERKSEKGCVTCPFAESGKLLPEGDFKSAKLVVVLDTPTLEEVRSGKRLFDGPAAERFWRELGALGIRREDCYITSLLKCAAGDETKARKNCLVQFAGEWAGLAGKVVLAVGAGPARFMTGKTGEKQWGQIVSGEFGATVLPVKSPSVVLFAESEWTERAWRRSLAILPTMVGREGGEKVPAIPFALVASPGDLREMVDYFLERSPHPNFAIDLETTGTDAWKPMAKILTLAVSDGEKTFVADLDSLGPVVDFDLKRLLEDPRKGKIAQNAKFEAVWLRRQKNIFVKPWEFDPAMARYLLDEGVGTSVRLKQLVWRYFPEYGGYESGIDMEKISELPKDQLCLYNATDAFLTYKLADVLREEIVREGMDGVMREILIPAIYPLAEMESQGLAVSRPALLKKKEESEAKMAGLLERINSFESVRKVEGFRITAPNDLKKLFYEVLGKTARSTTPKGQDGLTKEDLERWAEDGVAEAAAISEYKKEFKTLSTYIESYLERAQDGFLFPSYNMIVAKGGRLTSGDPNIQNVPSEMRSVFVSRFGEQGFLLQADFKQIEMRVMAIYAEDARLLQIFRDGLDPHTATAAQVLGVPLADVTREQRSAAKAVNFGLLYGMSVRTLAEREKMPIERAMKFYNGFFKQFKGVARWQERQKERANAGVKIESVLGRRRDVSMYSGDERVRRAYNFPIQSTASDINLFTLGMIWEAMRAENMKSLLIATVHDSILFDVFLPEHQRLVEIIRGVVLMLPGIFPWLLCPMEMDVSVGATWKEAK